VAGIGRQRAWEGDCGSRTVYATWPTSGARKWVASPGMECIWKFFGCYVLNSLFAL